jgi:hypothetical protein
LEHEQAALGAAPWQVLLVVHAVDCVDTKQPSLVAVQVATVCASTQ